MSKKSLRWGASEEKKGWKGLNNAAINSFNSNIINSFVREMFQNSNDARDKSLRIDNKTGKIPPLIISINYKQITKYQYPDYEGFIDIFSRIKSSEPNKKHVEFFKTAEKNLNNADAIKIFIFEDFNTIGLSGSDDDDNSSFSGCVLSEGISVNKARTSGGSYGIGKNAIFGFSQLRTVFYSSLNKNNEYIFQGIAKLATYFGKDKKKYSDRIFCGSGEELSSVRNINDLKPEYQSLFTRSKPGLSQYAVCPSEHINWADEFAKAILRNYWMLLYQAELVVELKEEDRLILRMENGNLEELLINYFNPDTYEPDDNVTPLGNPYEFYNCFKNGKRLKTAVDIIGNVSFYYSELPNNKTNVVAYLRNDMVVFAQPTRGFSSINYCGIFICEEEDGNSILRDMEPPTHDAFKPERLNDKSDKFNENDGKIILDGIKRIIRDALQTISDKYKKPAEDIPWLDELLTSLTGETGNGGGIRTNIESKSETPQRIGDKLSAKILLASMNRNSVVNDEKGQIVGVGSGKARGTAGGAGNTGDGGLEGKGGGISGQKKSMKTSIKSRVFKINQSKTMNPKEIFSYKMFIDSKNHLDSTDILISQKGDSGNVVFFEITSIKDFEGNEMEFSKVLNSRGEPIAYKLNSVSIPGEFLLNVSEPYKSSFKIVHA